MKTASKKQIQEWLDEYADLQSKHEKLTAAYEKKVEPARTEYQNAIEPLEAEFSAKSAPVIDRLKELCDQIEAAIINNTDAAGDPKIRVVAGEKGWVAEAAVSERRTVDPQVFFDKYHKKPGFWDALTVAIAKAEKLIGKTDLAAIADSVRNWRVNVRKG